VCGHSGATARGLYQIVNMVSCMTSDPVEILKSLVSIKSYSGNEGEIAYTIRDLLGENGVDKAFVDEYGNVIGIIRGESRAKIVFEGHMDVVPPGDLEQWKYPPFEPVIVDNKIYGRGTADMKGAIASMISSIPLINNPVADIYFVFVPYEEIAEGVCFSKAIEETLKINPDLVILGEATKLNVYRGHRGRAVIKIDIKGISAHASMPELALNPIVSLAYTIVRLREVNLPVHPELGRSTLSPTIIRCEPQSSPMIPDRCEIIIDYRMIPSEKKDEIIMKIKSHVKDIDGVTSVHYLVENARMWTGKTIRIEHYFPAWIYDGNLCIEALGLTRKYYEEAKLGYWRFSTDGVYSAGTKNIPTIGIGPGNEELAHKPNEYVPIKELYIARRIYAELAISLFH